jgi:NAD(P)-dependent dehydrogenase (short-subunit alcohol dehydrogenase family)
MGMLDGKVALIGGGTSGIGARTAEVFVREGARVVIAGRRADRGEALARSLGDHAHFVRADVSVERDVEAMVARTVGLFGRLDCLFNNAGAGGQRAGVMTLDLDRFDEAMATHVRGVLAGMKYAAPIMVSQGSGSIINTASVNGVVAGLGALTYAVAKAAVLHATRCAAVELGEKGIRVNSLSPGPIVTGIFGKGRGLDHDLADREVEAAEAGLAALAPRWQPLPLVGRADDVANCALFLASDASRLVTAHNLIVDGGICAGRPASAMRADYAAFSAAMQTAPSDAAGPGKATA